MVTIDGVALHGGGSEVVLVTMVGTEARIISEDNAQVQVEILSGPQREISGDVVMTSNTGAIVTGESGIYPGFKYLDAPSIFSVSPDSGRVASLITIVGVLCGGGKKIVNVSLAGFEAELISDESSCNTVKARAADFGANKTGDVILTADTGARVVKEDGWTYLSAGRIDSVTPNAGQADTEVTIKGYLLLGGDPGTPTVTLAGALALVKGSSEDEIIVTALSSDFIGLGDVVVVGASGVTTRLENGWTQSGITSINPNHGQRGTIITIAGEGLFAGGTNATRLRLTSADATIKSASATEIIAVIAGVTVSNDINQDVEIFVDNGQTVLAREGFTYKTAGFINGVLPISGQVGTIVTITGERLLGHGLGKLATVHLAGGQARKIVSATNNQVVVEAGSSSASVGDVVLTADTGAEVILADGF